MKNLYNINHWGEGYFQINEQGQLCVHAHAQAEPVVLKDILDTIQAKHHIDSPFILRFNNILRDRPTQLHQAFSKVIRKHGYQGHYTPVFPIKVNQSPDAIKTMLSTPDVPLGLEAGSKAELLAVLGLLGEKPRTIICNGHKDADYIKLALLAEQMGHHTYLVIEKAYEFGIIMQVATGMQVKPRLGVRLRLATTSAGYWEQSCGEKSKFGLTSVELLDLIDTLKEHGLLDCLQLMHTHLGSQIAKIQDIQQSLRELAHYYTQMRHLGVPLHTIDLGGGLAVDYQGTRSRDYCSMNYSFKEYAANIVLILREACKQAKVPAPNIITESGRAMVAHHAVLFSQVVHSQKPFENQVDAEFINELKHSKLPILRELADAYHAIERLPITEIYHDAVHLFSEVNYLFRSGAISLTDRAAAERLYQAICLEIHRKLDPSNRAHRELWDESHERFATRFYLNFSIFNSLPDAWAIKQIFPIVPITSFTKECTERAILHDLTCDSDGSILHYVDGDSVECSLPIPDEENIPYFGFFLVGAYQEALGGVHNLFSKTPSLCIELTEQGQFSIGRVVQGDSNQDILQKIDYDIEELLQSYQNQLARSPLSSSLQTDYYAYLRHILQQTTYLSVQS